MLELVKELGEDQYANPAQRGGAVYDHDGHYVFISTVDLDAQTPDMRRDRRRLQQQWDVPLDGEETLVFPCDENGMVQLFVPIHGAWGEGSREAVLTMLRSSQGRSYTQDEQLARAKALIGR